MNTCIRTGCYVLILPHYELMHGDLFEVGDCYAFHHTQHRAPAEPGMHYSVRFDLEDANYHTVETGGFIIIPKRFCSDFNYEGWTI